MKELLDFNRQNHLVPFLSHCDITSLNLEQLEVSKKLLLQKVLWKGFLQFLSIPYYRRFSIIPSSSKCMDPQQMQERISSMLPTSRPLEKVHYPHETENTEKIKAAFPSWNTSIFYTKQWCVQTICAFPNNPSSVHTQLCGWVCGMNGMEKQLARWGSAVHVSALTQCERWSMLISFIYKEASSFLM